MDAREPRLPAPQPELQETEVCARNLFLRLSAHVLPMAAAGRNLSRLGMAAIFEHKLSALRQVAGEFYHDCL